LAVTLRQAQSGAANEDTASESAIKTLIADRFNRCPFINVNANDLIRPNQVYGFGAHFKLAFSLSLY
jgi:hypothetical protein